MVSRVVITKVGADGGEGRADMGTPFYRVECVKENVVKVNAKNECYDQIKGYE